MLLGQTGEPPASSGKFIVPAPPTVQQTQPAPRPILGWWNREDRPVFSRIQGWFKRDQPEMTTQSRFGTPTRSGTIRETEVQPASPAPAPSLTPAEFPRKLPNPSSQAPQKPDTIVRVMAPTVSPDVQPISLKQTASTQNAKSPILAHLANKVGRDEKFEWVTGQIEIESGKIVLYYATPETVDKYNGRLVLATEKADLNQFRRGDLVSVRGQLSQRPGTTPIYRVSFASLIERPKQ
jgi:hypothetical protein